MKEDTIEQFNHSGGIASLWAGVLAPPVGWALDEQVKYMALTYICSPAGVVLIYVVTLLTLALVIGGGVLSWRNWQKLGSELPDDVGGTEGRSRFLALLGVFSSLLFSLVIIAQWLPSLFFYPCERGM